MNLAVVNEAVTEMNGVEHQFTEEEKNFVVQFAFRSGSKEDTISLIEALAHSEDKAESDEIMVTYRAKYDMKPAWVEQVENLQLLLDKIYSPLDYDSRYKGSVCVCLPLMVSTALFPCGVTGFCEEYPDIKVISLTTLGSPDYREMGIDFGIVTTLPESLKDFSLLYKKNIECRFFAVPGYLAKYGTPGSLDDLLANHRIINGLQNENYVPGWKELMSKAKNISFSSNSTFAVLEAIRHGVGIGLMPRQFQGGGLVRLDELAGGLQMPVYLVVNNCTKDIPRVKIVTEYYKAALDRI